MEKQKFQIGDEVSVSFIGQIKEVYASGDKILYVVDEGDTFARRLKESQIALLPKPEDFPEVNAGEMEKVNG